MIRVCFIVNFKNNEWLGGINYFRNLLCAIYANPNSIIEPVMFTGYTFDNKLEEEFPRLHIVRDHIFDYYHPYALVRFALKILLNRDIILERLLKKEDISVLSHSILINKKPPLPTIGWIPDFQHKYLPDFFTRTELSQRDKNFQRICENSTRVIFSSNVAKSDAERFYPNYIEKYRVLHFVAEPLALSDIPNITVLNEKYAISEPYFIVPNQFWVHKNHITLLKAVSLLKKKGYPVTVIATGNPFDYRRPTYFNFLQNKIKEFDIGDNFRVLGIVPYNDLQSLMIHSVAIINPSLFEGWSTSVEEAKSLNLTVILSDISVHREQDPEKGLFFSPTDANQLADMMIKTLREYEKKAKHDKKDFADILKKMIESKIIFAQDYERIVIDAYNDFSIK
jgi:glycosyltransferase involved in cell wall biosynthesis